MSKLYNGRVKRAGGGPGLYANIAAKKAGAKGSPTAANFKRAKQTARS